MIGAGVLADRVDRRHLLAGIYVMRGLDLLVPLIVGANCPVLLFFSVLIGIAFLRNVPGYYRPVWRALWNRQSRAGCRIADGRPCTRRCLRRELWRLCL